MMWLNWLLALVIAVFWSLPVTVAWSIWALLRGRKPAMRYRLADGGDVFLLSSRVRVIRDAPLFFGILSGRFRLCGRGIRYENEALPVPELAKYPAAVFSPWRLYRRCRIGTKSQDEVELEYCRHAGLRADMGLLLRTAFGGLFFDEPESEEFLPELSLFGIPFSNLTLQEGVDRIMQAVETPSPAGTTVFFVNPHCFNLARRDTEFYSVLKQAEQRYPDGSGIVMASRMMRTPLRENVNGTDLFPGLCRVAATRDISLYLLGGKPGVAEAVQDRMQREFPTLRFAGVEDGYFDLESGSAPVIARIQAARPDILLVALGMPLQEKWLMAHREELGVPVRLAVGGLFDFYSGRTARAPEWLREIGLEWFFRLWLEPRRMWKRYLIGNPVFLFAVWRMLRKQRKNRSRH